MVYSIIVYVSVLIVLASERVVIPGHMYHISLLLYTRVFKKSNFLVLARVSRPGWLSREVCKSGRGWFTRRGEALLYIPLFLRGGDLRQILSKDMRVAYTRCVQTAFFKIQTVQTARLQYEAFSGSRSEIFLLTWSGREHPRWSKMQQLHNYFSQFVASF